MVYDKSPLPTHHGTSTHCRRRKSWSFAFISLLIFATFSYLSTFIWQEQSRPYTRIPYNAYTIAEKCSKLRLLPSPPPDFYSRKESDRFDASLAPKNPVLIRNATIWTGEVAEGLEVVFGDVLFDKGVIKGVGNLNSVEGEVEEINVHGAWVTTGIVDLHSHLGDFSAPSLSGSADTNSRKGLAQPWLRSVDALNTHDEAYRLALAGGVTSALTLPGSAGAIGGQAFSIKLRPTSEKSTSSMLLESPFDSPSHWRHLKQACGENPSRVYSGTRMDTIWSFRAAYEEARKLRDKQDVFCEKINAGRWDLVQNASFPEDLQWEALVDVLRGKVKIQNHCYEAVDLDGIVRLSNEFNFSIAGFHHAHEAYLVPKLLKETYGYTPVVALFATNGRYKRESYRGSEYAPKVLSDNGIEVVMKSDHPVMNSRYLLHEAQQAHYYGLPVNLALASITTTPAKAAGLDHRIGKVKRGYDADLVIWDSHPLALGAMPVQVFVDGIPQLSRASTSVHPNPQKGQIAPTTPQFDEEAREAVKADGLPSLDAKEVKGRVIFYRVKSLYLRIGGRIFDVFHYPKAENAPNEAEVLIQDGEIICVTTVSLIDTASVKTCDSSDLDTVAVDARIDLEGGSVAPGLSAFGTPLGLQHIAGEVSTGDGKVDSKIAGQDIIKAIDGLQFRTRDALLAYRSGVTTGITPPSLGLATAFSTGASHKLQPGAIVKEESALHVIVTLNAEESVSTQVRDLRKALVGAANGGGEGELGKAFKRVVEGEIPLVVNVQSADVMATLINLKKEVEDLLASKNDNDRKQIRVTFVGAAEAHLLAPEIAQAGVGVVVAPSRPFPYTWESLRILPGPPLSEKTAVSTLLEHNVTVGIGVFTGSGAWISRNLRWDVAWVALDSEGTINHAEALELASTKLEGLLGLDVEESDRWGDLVATRGGELLEFEGKVVAVSSRRRGVVDVF